MVGDWAYAVAMSVYAYREGGATAVGVLGVARYLSMATMAPFSSTLADRFDRRHVMVAADVLRAGLVGLAAALVAVDAPAIAVYVIAVVTAVIGTAFRPAQAALLPRLANHPGELTAANVVASTVESVGFFVGPALAGALLAFADLELVFVLNAASFVWSAALVAGVRVLTPVDRAASEGGDGEGEDTAEGRKRPPARPPASGSSARVATSASSSASSVRRPSWPARPWSSASRSPSTCST